MADYADYAGYLNSTTRWVTITTDSSPAYTVTYEPTILGGSWSGAPKKESALAWLDRRVDEMRVKL